jgi:hypothetical protein
MKKEGKIKKAIKKIIGGWTLFFLLAFAAVNFLVVSGVIFQQQTVRDEQLEPYFQYFKQAAISYRVSVNYDNLVIGFVDRYPKPDWLALCQKIGSIKFVTVLKSHFDKAPTEEKYAIIVHELGHCALGLPHKDGYFMDGCPISIMHPSDSMFGCFFKNQDYYFKEMFGIL